MVPPIDPEVKALQPYLLRANEVAKTHPKISYYVREFVASKGLEISHRSQELTAMLTKTLEEMEQGKSQIDKLDREGDALEMERFAIEIFDRADKVDRAGAATEDTARRFYAASVFMTALETFGPLRDDLVTKGRYAMWKAAQIRKAIREGRKPEPGAPGERGVDDSQPGETGGTPAEPSASPQALGQHQGADEDDRRERNLASGPQAPSGPPALPPAPAPTVTLSSEGFPPPPAPRLSGRSAGGPGGSDGWHSRDSSVDLPDPPAAVPLPPPPPPSQPPPGPPNGVYPRLGGVDAPAVPQGGHAAAEAASRDWSGHAGGAGGAGVGGGHGAPALRQHDALPANSAPPMTRAPTHSGHQAGGQTSTLVHPAAIAEARKAAKHAVSALDFDDVAAAKSFLRRALQQLGD